MSAKCPRCQARISVFHIGSAFECEACHTSLTARYSVALIAAIALWILGDFAIAALCRALSPSYAGWYALARVLGSAVLALVLYVGCFPAWTTIQASGAAPDSAALVTSRRWVAAVVVLAWLCGGFFVFLFLVFGAAAAGELHWFLIVFALLYLAIALWSITRVLSNPGAQTGHAANNAKS